MLRSRAALGWVMSIALSIVDGGLIEAGRGRGRGGGRGEGYGLRRSSARFACTCIVDVHFVPAEAFVAIVVGLPFAGLLSFS